MEENQPKDLFIIQDLETLRDVADPLRMQIYEILIPGPANVRQLAERLGLAPSRLYYHVNTLEKIGLIRVVETRMVANILEKYYRAVAYQLDLAPHLLTFETDEGKTAVTELLIGGLDTTREDLLRSLQARTIEVEQGALKKARQVLVNRITARIPDSKADEFHARLGQLISEFEASDVKQGEEAEACLNYALMVAFYPSFYYQESK